MLLRRARAWRPEWVVGFALIALLGTSAGSKAQLIAPPLPAAGMFLVARAGMPDRRFARTVVLLVRYGRDGALGLMVNRPTGVTLANAFPELDNFRESDDVVWFGGPVQPQRAAVLINAAQGPEPSLKVMQSLHFSTRPEVLAALKPSDGTKRFRTYAGYAGWAPSQLDAELARGDWIVRPASVEQVFAPDVDKLWHRLMETPGTWVMASHHGIHADRRRSSVTATLLHDVVGEFLDLHVEAQHRAVSRSGHRAHDVVNHSRLAVDQRLEHATFERVYDHVPAGAERSGAGKSVHESHCTGKLARLHGV